MNSHLKRALDERFEEIIKTEVATYDNLIELENMPFVDTVTLLGDRVIVEREGQQFFLKLK